MQTDSFLLNLYLGFLDPAVLRAFKPLEADDKCLEIIEKYKKLTGDFPPALLEDKGTIPADAMARLKEIGFFGLSIPSTYGGEGLDVLQYLKVAEAITSENMSLGFTALAHLSIGTKGIVLFGTEAQKRRYLVPAAAGDMIFSYALTEPKTGSDAKHIETTARLSDDGRHYVLNGLKTYITNANYADGLTVFAQLDPDRPGFMGAFVVETAWNGVKIGKDMPKMGLHASSTASVRFDNVKVPRENLLGQPGDGFKIAMTILNHGRLALGAGSAGMMEKSLADMTRRSAARRQFGVPINTFELIQEKLVKARVNGYVTSAITALCADRLNENPLAPMAIESSHCKLFGTTRTWDTLYDAMQVAGGAGYLSTLPYEKRMRDFRVTTIFEGTTEIHSIYPALYAMRQLGKRLQSEKGSTLSKLRFFVKGLLRRNRWPLRFNQPHMDRALRFAKSNARRIRCLLFSGLLVYGKQVIQKEFFLRRVTHLSLYMFGILAVLARIDAKRRAGGTIREDLDILAYFIEDARRMRGQDRGLRRTRIERSHAAVVHGLISVEHRAPADAAAQSEPRLQRTQN
jgi:acyl-CoA dehydrogenase family protein 9